MNIEWQIAPPGAWQADAILFFAFEKASELLPGFQRWLDAEGAWLKQSPAFADFQSKPQSVALFYAPPGSPLPRVLCANLGPADKFDIEKLQGAAASALRQCRELQIPTAALPLDALEGLPLEPGQALLEALVGGLSGLYRFDRLKTRDVEPAQHPEQLLVLSATEPSAALREVPKAAEAIAAGITLARDLATAPANEATPTHLLETAWRLAGQYGFTLQAIDIEEARRLGMGAFAAVAQGSREPAYLIVLEHTPAETGGEAPLIFIGKGITFDTGGISLKASANMEAMKHDMSGAANVLGLFESIGRLQLKRHVVGILPCTENMPGGKAYKPGDVLRTLSGLTVEVISTDAEGRLILADALAYAQRYNPALIVDMATLTGACIVALGHRIAAVMGNREELIHSIQQIGERVGERFWPLPLYEFFFEQIKSDVADFKNVGDRSAATIVAGVFLKQFVPDQTPWAHLDIAGTAWTDKDLGSIPKGATAFGLRTILELVQKRGNGKNGDQ